MEARIRVVGLLGVRSAAPPISKGSFYRLLCHSSLAPCLGNHEFDEDITDISHFVQNITGPVLAANINFDGEPKLSNLPNLMKSTVLIVNNTRIGIIGYLTPDTKVLTPRNNLIFEDEIESTKKEVVKLKYEGVDIIIALGHSGFMKDKQIAKEVEEIDLVIGGHSNTFLVSNTTIIERPEFPQGDYPTIVTQKSGRKVLVVQAYAYTKYMGHLRLTFNSNGEIVKYDGYPILMSQDIPEDPEVLKLVETYRNITSKVYNEIIGVSEVFLNGECRLRECNLGNIITDSVLNYTKRKFEEFADANIVLVQGGRIRSSIEHPEKPMHMTRGEWMTVLPFSDVLCVLTMNGSTLLKVLEHSIAAWRLIDSSGQFMQMSGMNVVYDLSMEPGSRVSKAYVVCSGCDKNHLALIRKESMYKVILPKFIADGGDSYSILLNIEQQCLPYSELDCIFDYIKNYGPINPRVTGRITIINENKVNFAIRLKPIFISTTINIILLFLLSNVITVS